MAAEDVARGHYLDRRRLSNAVAELARRAWSRLNPANLDASWRASAPELLVGLTGAQLAAARAADVYAAEVLEEYGPAVVNPAAFAGRASDGRPLDTLLLNPVTVVKVAAASGVSVAEALAAGFANLDMLVRTQLADAGRAADQVALVAHPAAEGYTRMLVGRSCSRCLVLAGRWYAWNAGFRRHPRCDCIHVPGRRPSDGVQVDLRRTFESMSRVEQDKTFTINGAQAIRDGADIGRVVNARRGMATAGETRTRIRSDGLVVNERIRRQTTTRVGGRDIFTTTEAAGRKPRLMPEEIYRIAGSDRGEARRLLRSNGYLSDARPRIARPAPPKIAGPAPARDPVMHVPASRPVAGPVRKTLQDRVEGGVVSREKLAGGQVAETSLVTLTDGSKAVLKSAKPIGPRLSAVQQQDAEELAALIIQTTGLRAPATYRSGPHELYMEFMSGKIAQQLPSGNDDLPEVALRDEDQFRLLGLVDQLIYNSDRHRGNWLVTDAGEIHPIDHGMAFVDRGLMPPGRGLPVITDFKEPSWQFARAVEGTGRWIDHDMSPADMSLVRQRLEALRPQFERLGRLAWYEDILSRLDAMAAHAKGSKRRVR